MKKCVLNIEKLFAGKTANALVLEQVDEEFPTFIPSAKSLDEVSELVKEWSEVYDDFTPTEEEQSDLDKFNEFVMNFNLELQQDFKDQRKDELYMMDDTQTLKSNKQTYANDKTYMHCLDGKAIDKDEDGNDCEINSSQLNVLFPFKKMGKKSMYQRQLSVDSEYTIDDLLEQSKLITLEGQCSFYDCLQGVASVGDNLYPMSSIVNVENDTRIFGNGLTMTIVAGQKYTFIFPQSMALYQPSGEYGLKSSISDFVDWFKKHNHKTYVSVQDVDYGSNASTLECLGKGSYNLSLATYAPTNIVLDGESTYDLNADQFRSMRNSDDESQYYSGNYIFDNGNGDVGFLFNLYDNFISGNDRIIRMTLPKNSDYSRLMVDFSWTVVLESMLNDIMEVSVQVNDSYVAYENDNNEYIKLNNQQVGPVGSHIKDSNILDSGTKKDYSYLVPDTATQSNSIEIVVRIHFNVDYSRRLNNKDYADALKKSGLIITNIRILNGIDDEDAPSNLTFGDYVNENGISDDDYDDRLKSFFNVWKYKDYMTYQSIIETSLNNTTSAAIEYCNNYSTGDLYGDVFVTKSLLNPQYDMSFALNESGDGLITMGRKYKDIQGCSNQLALLYTPTKVTMKAEKMSDEEEDVVTYDIDEQNDDNDEFKDGLNYEMVEVVKNINRFESSVKHKSNVFSVVVENSNLAPTTKDEDDLTDDEKMLEKYKETLRNSIKQFVRNTCESVTPVHTQLFDVQFT